VEVETSRNARPEVQATTIKVKRTPGAGASQWDHERRMDRLFSLVVLFKTRHFIQVLSFSSLVIPSAARNLVSREPNMPDSSLRSK
jgi:hypothetical protein